AGHAALWSRAATGREESAAAPRRGGDAGQGTPPPGGTVPESDSPTETSGAADAKITMFSAKTIATELQAETKQLRARVRTLEAVVREYGALESAEVSLRIEALP